jgi:hypothetical protein
MESDEEKLESFHEMKNRLLKKSFLTPQEKTASVSI